MNSLFFSFNVHREVCKCLFCYQLTFQFREEKKDIFSPIIVIMILHKNNVRVCIKWLDPNFPIREKISIWTHAVFQFTLGTCRERSLIRFYASTALMEAGSSLSSSPLIGTFSIPKFPMAKLMKTCDGSRRRLMTTQNMTVFLFVSVLRFKCNHFKGIWPPWHRPFPL